MIEFYNVRKKETVNIDSGETNLVVYVSTTKKGKTVTRYGVKAIDEDGTKLTKFISKDTYNELQEAGVTTSS